MLGSFLKSRGISKKGLIAIKHQGGKVLVNGRPETVRFKLTEGDRVQVFFPPEKRSEGLRPDKLPLKVVFEDDYLLILDKPSGLPVIPSIRYPEKTLANGVLHYFDEQGLGSTVHFLNRLDKDTEGLLAVAKFRHVHHLLTADMKRVRRKYQAWVKGELAIQSGTVDAPIARLEEGKVIRGVREDGQRAVTHFRVLEVQPGKTLVECCLETGRTHQIRVHMAHLGHPLLGDTLYDPHGDPALGGQCLRSYHLAFCHPITGEELVFEI